jgi:hypothetical protein
VRVGPGRLEVSRSEIYQNPSKNQGRSRAASWRTMSGERRTKGEGGEQPRAATQLAEEDGATPQCRR